MNNELYLGPSVDVAQSNQLGAAALTILHGNPALGHEKKINAGDFGALLVAYIIFNDETVGLFVYDEDDGAYVHHQFMSSRVERCLLAHAAEISAPFLQPQQATYAADYEANYATDIESLTDFSAALKPVSDLIAPHQASPEVLLQATLAHLTASQRLYRKIRAIRKSDTPAYAVKSHLSKSIVITRLAWNQNNRNDKEYIEQSSDFVSWLSNKSDDEIARVVEDCRLIDRPKTFKVLFETPDRITLKTLRILDTFDAFSAQLVGAYADRYDLTNAEARVAISQPMVRHLIDRGLIHRLGTEDIAQGIYSAAQ